MYGNWIALFQIVTECEGLSGSAGVSDFAALSDFGSIEGCEQRRRPIPFVVMGSGLATSAFERQARLGAIQGLDLTLLIQTQHQSVLRWVQVQTYDIGQLL